MTAAIGAIILATLKFLGSLKGLLVSGAIATAMGTILVFLRPSFIQPLLDQLPGMHIVRLFIDVEYAMDLIRLTTVVYGLAYMVKAVKVVVQGTSGE